MSSSSAATNAAAPMTLASAALVLFTSAAGAGVLSYPFAAMQQGYVLLIAFTCLLAANSAFTVGVLAASAAIFQRRFSAATFEELCHKALGRRAA